MITPSEIICLRLQNHQIAKSRFRKPEELAGYMGALQAQNYPMAKWAFGLRTPGSTKAIVDNALNDGKLVRTHILRPTWHVVAAIDLPWMLNLTAPRIWASLRLRHKGLGLTPEEFERSFGIITDSLINSPGKTRDELTGVLNMAGIKTTGNNRAAHIFLAAELKGLICSGKEVGKKTTYALLKERIPETGGLEREKAIVLLAKRYFLSHGPATVEDFSWWSGLTLKEARSGIAAVSSDLDSAHLQSRTYWFAKADGSEAGVREKAYLLPAFDEFIVSYRDRSAIFNPGNMREAISSNGIFWPVVIVGGKVAGLWKQIAKKNEIIIETALFRKLTRKEKECIREAAVAFGAFLNTAVSVRF